jgi:hypothetical protein
MNFVNPNTQGWNGDAGTGGSSLSTSKNRLFCGPLLTLTSRVVVICARFVMGATGEAEGARVHTSASVLCVIHHVTLICSASLTVFQIPYRVYQHTALVPRAHHCILHPSSSSSVSVVSVPRHSVIFLFPLLL